MINYFNFKQFDNEYLLTNDFGKYMFVTKEELRSTINNNVDFDSDFGRKAEENYFAFQCSKRAFADKAKHLMRESKSYLFQSTGLHIFVVTNSCNMQCVYCQAQNGNDHPHGMMDHKTAERAVDIALQSPNDYLSFEFQGGEPLSNFDTIKHIVEYTEAKNFTKQIEFNLVSNLTLLTEDIADYIKRHDIKVSTSIDGNMPVHNTNRQYRSSKGTFDDVVSGIKLLRSKDVEVGAILTTTRQSLDHAKEIVDAYVSLGLTNVFIRPLTPLGCASNQWSEIGYTPEQFVTFYHECFDYILALNEQGVNIKEGTALLILPKILYGYPVNYMELRSPCGVGIGQLAYYYDGNVYTCDEGRMLSEMGDDSFRLGNVYQNTYNDLINNPSCKAACVSSVLESLPECSSCVYNPFCGTCPVVNLAQNKNFFQKTAHSYRCKINTGIMDKIFHTLNSSNKQIIEKRV